MNDKRISSWSFTKVLDFERCPFYAYLKYACYIPEPKRPLREGETEQANDRGSRLHEAADQFINRKVNILDPGLRAFKAEFNQLRNGMAENKVTTEEEWGFNREYERTDWKTAWHRSKVDAQYKLDPYRAITIDFKSGRKDGNEAKHGQQLQLYAVDTIMRDPQIEEVTCEAWYLDKDEITTTTYPRAVVLSFKRIWMKRGDAVTNATSFPAKPNKWNCKYCEYGPWNGGQCQRGVR